MAVVTPIPSASVTTAMIVYRGCRRRSRAEYAKSCMSPLQHWTDRTSRRLRPIGIAGNPAASVICIRRFDTRTGGAMSKKVKSAVLTIVAVLMLGWHLQAQTPRRPGPDGNVRAAIEAANKKFFIDAAPKGDAALLASVYTEDAIAYPANAEAVKGRAALQAMWKAVFDSGITGFELTTEEV